MFTQIYMKNDRIRVERWENAGPTLMRDSDAIVYVAQKRDDYRYNTGRVWVEDVKRQKEERDGKR